MMDLVSILKSILPAFDWYEEGSLFSVAGYDAADTALANLHAGFQTIILVEDLPEGFLSFEQGFLDNQTLSFWLMQAVKENETDKQSVLQTCHARGLNLIRNLIALGEENEFAYALDRKRISYFARGPLSGHYGYEFLLTFRVDMDMTLSP